MSLSKEGQTNTSVENIPTRGNWLKDLSVKPISSDADIQKSLQRRQELIDGIRLQRLRQEIRDSHHELDV